MHVECSFSVVLFVLRIIKLSYIMGFFTELEKEVRREGGCRL